ncbi:MAG: NAD(P)H-hydrate dehydratase [Treponema sp.]|nr:NAD(P)H-hydrate dehydratase [Treponema sp.]
MKLVTAARMREIEKKAEKEYGIPSILLMENAAVKITEHCVRVLSEINNPRVLIACGSGNNGGDGFAVARYLHVKGIDVRIILIGDTESVKGDAEVNLKIIKKLNIPADILKTGEKASLCANSLQKYDLIIDAIFGTGLSRNIEGGAKQLIETLNKNAKYVISVDIPSGVHSDTGRIMGCAVKANETITLGYAKTGLYLYPGAEYTGKISIEDIGIPPQIQIQAIEKNEMNKIENEAFTANIFAEDDILNILPLRKKRSNKGDFGKVTVFAGSDEMPGAAALACSAAYMTGCGLVRACVTAHTSDVIHKWQREVVTCNVIEKNGMYCKESLMNFSANKNKSVKNLTEEINSSNVIVLGPGIGRSAGVTEFILEFLDTVKVPVIIDADALFAISENVNILKTLKAPCVITPHPGEMSRLTSLSVPEILDDIAGTALNFAKEFNVITLLKDAHTVIASPDGEININITGNNALSKAGTGDALSGIIAGFASQICGKSMERNNKELIKNIFNACILGAYFHGIAAEAACLEKSIYSVTASDVINKIPVVMMNKKI